MTDLYDVTWCAALNRPDWQQSGRLRLRMDCGAHYSFSTDEGRKVNVPKSGVISMTPVTREEGSHR
jgi:hypothetical protein